MSILRYAGSRSALVGTFGAWTIAAMVMTDFVRRLLPGQSININLVPLVLAIVAVAVSVIFRTAPRLPLEFRVGIAALLGMCAWGTVVGWLNGLPPRQLLAGWIAEAGAVPGLVMGFALAFQQRGWQRFYRAVFALFCGSMVVALVQQFGMLSSDAFGMIDGAHVQRGLSSGQYFHYTPGPFRTANVFSFFLAVVGLIMVVALSDRGSGSTSKSAWAMPLLSLVLLLGALMAARRSGLMMLLGALIPAVFSTSSRWKFFALILGLGGVFMLFADGGDTSAQVDLDSKLHFATTEADVSGRLADALEVGPEDWRLLSFYGNGIGAHGPATQAGGQFAFEQDMYLLILHPIIHVGWFKDLLGFGPVGATAHLIWFMMLLVAVWRAQKLPGLPRIAARYSGTAFAAMAIVNYYFVATSWLQSVTGGLLFGIAIGSFVGRMHFMSSIGRLRQPYSVTSVTNTMARCGSSRPLTAKRGGAAT